MIDIIVGESIVFGANVKDEDGTAITGLTGTLTVTDGLGSVVYNGTVSHSSAGTYVGTLSSSGWGLGGVKELWVFPSAAGTTIDRNDNRFRVVSASPTETYIQKEELRGYYENIEDYYDGTEDALIVDACNALNAKLQSLGYSTPVKPLSTGYHDQILRDMNAYGAVSRIVAKRHASLSRRDDERPWFAYFDEKYKACLSKLEKKEYSLERDYSPGESGVGIATKTAGTRNGVLETNWRGGIGDGLLDWTFQRDWKVNIYGTGTAGEVNECQFRYSSDDGMSWGTGGTTSYEWTHIGSGVHVRFHKGTSSGSTNLFAVGDTWEFKTTPKGQVKGGKRIARSY